MKSERTKGIFITGSGTGVGKTRVSGLLLKDLARRGYRVTYMKPVETGCGLPPDKKTLTGADADHVYRFIEHKADIELRSPYRFEPACSPHLAARLAGSEIDIDRVVSAYEGLCEETSADIAIVEGAGGVLVPVNANEYIIDMIAALDIPAILVTDPGLGTLNHTFLSLRELERYGIPTIGVVINNARGIERDFVFEDNVKTIREFIAPAPCLVVYYNDDNSQITEFCNDVLSRV